MIIRENCGVTKQNDTV